MRRPLAFLLILFLVSGCATSSGNNSSETHAASSFPKPIPKVLAEEVAIGEQINATIMSSFYPYTEPKVVNYLNLIGGKLAANAGRRLPYRFTLLYSDKIYATSAPGGFVYLTTGMLYFLENEAELAAVLSHEIGELQFQDPKLSRSRKVLDAVTKGGSAVAPVFGEIGMLAMLGLVGVNMVADKKRKGNPNLSKSDKLALHYMVESGYDPQGMVDLLYKFISAKNEVIPYFFDYAKSRPITEDRFHSLQSEFAKLPLQDKTLSVNRKEYKEMIAGVAEIYQR